MAKNSTKPGNVPNSNWYSFLREGYFPSWVVFLAVNFRKFLKNRNVKA